MSLQGKLQAFCSYEGNHSSFLTTKESVSVDIDKFLEEHGAPAVVRREVFGLLISSDRPPSFSEGFRFEQNDDTGRTVVYASLPNRFVDEDKLDADEALSRLQDEKLREGKPIAKPRIADLEYATGPTRFVGLSHGGTIDVCTSADGSCDYRIGEREQSDTAPKVIGQQPAHSVTSYE